MNGVSVDRASRVPLIIAIPGQAPRVIEDDAELVDVAPTLLDLVGAPIPANMRGRSLMPRIEGHPQAAAPIFAGREGADRGREP